MNITAKDISGGLFRLMVRAGRLTKPRKGFIQWGKHRKIYILLTAVCIF